MRISNLPCDGTLKVAPVKSKTWSRGSDLKFAISFKFEENFTNMISESQLAEYSSLFIENDNEQQILVSTSLLHKREMLFIRK